MNIDRIKKLTTKPGLYEKGTAEMWTDPHISAQLLDLHINPDNDIASRSGEKIQLLTNWILNHSNKPQMQILDLGCGPGLYTESLAQKGHEVTGVDFSETSIQYARHQSVLKKLNIEYLHQNYLHLDFEDKFDLAIMIYLDFCALIPRERDQVLENICRALKKGGLFIFDVNNPKNIDKKMISQGWEVSSGGFWRNGPYMALSNGYHYPSAHVYANQHVVIDENEHAESYVFWNHYYDKEEIAGILGHKGFSEISNWEHVLPESNDVWNGENITFYIAKKTN
jgi:SAM-dependent methyltransferase